MPYCTQCGTFMAETDRFCTQCGFLVGVKSNAQGDHSSRHLHSAKTNELRASLQTLAGMGEGPIDSATIGHLPTVLNSGELPEAIIGISNLGWLLATDRRILKVQKALFSSKLKVDSFNYQDIESVEPYTSLGSKGIAVHCTSGKKTLISCLNKDRFEEFTEFLKRTGVHVRYPVTSSSSNTGELDNEKSSSNLRHARTSKMRAKLQTLAGVDQAHIDSPTIDHLLQILDDGELPGAIIGISNLGWLLATDRRILKVQKALFSSKLKVDSFNYQDIESVEPYTSLGSEGIAVHCTSGKKTLTSCLNKDRFEEFTEFLKRTGVDVRYPAPPSSSNKGEPNDEDSIAKEVLEWAWPLIMLYLAQKKGTGGKFDIADLALKVGIPAAVLPLIMPILKEKIDEFMK